MEAQSNGLGIAPSLVRLLTSQRCNAGSHGYTSVAVVHRSSDDEKHAHLNCIAHILGKHSIRRDPLYASEAGARQQPKGT